MHSLVRSSGASQALLRKLDGAENGGAFGGPTTGATGGGIATEGGGVGAIERRLTMGERASSLVC